VIFPTIPTAENMASEAFKLLKAQYKDSYGNHLTLERVRLYETPNSWTDATY
jgi:6-pyruvoyltetrahydropterin/6-carboxytetrahydropterin synthase